jgi:predicted transcriptional regulator
MEQQIINDLENVFNQSKTDLEKNKDLKIQNITDNSSINSKVDADLITDEIKELTLDFVHAYIRWQDKIYYAIKNRIWLFYSDVNSWEEYVAEYLNIDELNITHMQRIDGVRNFLIKGLSKRQIAIAYGVNVSTISRDSQVLHDATPDNPSSSGIFDDDGDNLHGKIWTLHNGGLSERKIAKQVHISQPAVHKHLEKDPPKVLSSDGKKYSIVHNLNKQKLITETELKAYQLFLQNKTQIQIAQRLNKKQSQISDYINKLKQFIVDNLDEKSAKRLKTLLIENTDISPAKKLITDYIKDDIKSNVMDDIDNNLFTMLQNTSIINSISQNVELNNLDNSQIQIIDDIINSNLEIVNNLIKKTNLENVEKLVIKNLLIDILEKIKE